MKPRGRLMEMRRKCMRRRKAYEISIQGSMRRLRIVRYTSIQTPWVTASWARTRGLYESLRYAPKFFREQKRKIILRLCKEHAR